MKQELDSFQSGDCVADFSAKSTKEFFPPTCCTKHKKHDKQELVLLNEVFFFTEMVCLCCRTYCCCDSQSNKLKFSILVKSLNEKTLADCGDGPMSKYHKVLERLSM